jgi:hypothetical protein
MNATNAVCLVYVVCMQWWIRMMVAQSLVTGATEMTCAGYALSILVRFARRESLQGRDEEGLEYGS